MFGKPRRKMTRLLKPAYRGDMHIYVEPGYDFVPGDWIALLPTSYDNLAADDVILTAYDNITGIANLTEPLKYYHWGNSLSTSFDYNGVDMRGEVITLSRNIRIRGTDEEHWGGEVVTSDSVEFDP